MSKNMKDVSCIFCKADVSVDVGSKAALCANCVGKLSDAPPVPKTVVKLPLAERIARKEARLAKRKAKTTSKLTKLAKGRGRGWHLKKLFLFDGVYYSFGKQIDDAAAAKLKKAVKV